MHANISQMMADHLHQAQSSFEELQRLKSQVLEMQKELELLKATGGDQGWMVVKKAADLVGINVEALKQRFRRGTYPEGKVWNLENGRYVVNLRELRRYMTSDTH